MVARSTLQMDSSRVAVQNTFIHMIVGDDEATDLPNLKRSSSVPPSQRFGEQAAVKYDECYADIDVSTDAGSVKEIIDTIETPTVSGSFSPFERSCTPCSLEDESPYQQQSLQDWPYGTCNWTAAAMPVYIVQAPVAVVNPSPAAAVEQNALPPVETTPKPKPTPLRLNSQAMAWTPNAAAAPPVSKKANKEAHALGRRLLLVVETVKSVLATCLWISTVELSESTLGHTLTLQVKPEHSERKNDILMLAKAQISTSATSMGLHFVGHQADPFVPMPTGVAVKLCHVKDVDKICWDLLRTGICSYGAHCHWKHPKSEKRVEVKIMLAESF